MMLPLVKLTRLLLIRRQRLTCTPLSINEMDRAGFTQDVVRVLDKSVEERLNAEDWSILFANANMFGAPINANLIPIEVAGIWRVDNYHQVDRNVWIPYLTSVKSRVRSGDLIFNVRKAVGFYSFDEDGDIIQDHFTPEPWFVLKRLTVRSLPTHNLFRGITFAHYWWEERYEI